MNYHINQEKGIGAGFVYYRGYSKKKKETAKRKKKHLILDDGEESIKSNLDEIDLMKGEIHKKLKEKHGYCYIKDDRHLPLTTLHLSMWTDEIVTMFHHQINHQQHQQEFLEELDKQYGEVQLIKLSGNL
ncbi:unnamed protein product [Rhizophagus irregularis]|nr:unnamed protein product [Rhizophagus irregularis]